MADEIITRQQLVDASVDAESLQKFISGTDIEDVLTRLGQIYPTLAKLVRILMETGGWKAYETEAILLATTPLVNPSVGYAFDTKKLYLWNGAIWKDEGTSPLDLAKAYVDANPLFKPGVLTSSDNLNNMRTEGYFKPTVNVPSLALNYPVVALGELHVRQITGNVCVQTYWVYGTFGQWVRTTDGAGNWLAWELLGTQSLVNSWIEASKAPVVLATDFDVQTLSKTDLYLAFSNPTTPVTTSHLPTAGEQYYIDYFHNAGVRRMIAYARSSNSVFTCWYWGTNGWSAWVKLTIQTDLDAYKTEVNSLINSKTNPLETYISDLYAKLNDFHSVKIKLVGDSITWGAGADPISAIEPRHKELTDPRNMTDPLSPTWANLLRQYLCHTFGDTTRTEDAPGSAYTKRKKFISFREYINRFTFKSNTGAVVSSTTALQNVSNTSLAKNGEVMTLLGANFQSQRQNEFTFDIVSDNVSILYVKQAIGDINDICEVYVDGVLAGTFNYYDTNVSYENEFSTTFAYGKHTIRVKNIATNAASNVLIQCCATVQKVWLINEGINGTNTMDWINKLLAGTINLYDDFVFLQIGTNDRGTRGASLFKTNLNTLLNNISTLSSNNSKVLMLTSIPDSPSNATNPAYQYNMQTVDEIITTVAKERNLAHISQYKHTTQYVINGTVIWSDGLHPNNAGHKIMYENLRDQLFAK